MSMTREEILSQLLLVLGYWVDHSIYTVRVSPSSEYVQVWSQTQGSMLGCWMFTCQTSNYLICCLDTIKDTASSLDIYLCP